MRTGLILTAIASLASFLIGYQTREEPAQLTQAGHTEVKEQPEHDAARTGIMDGLREDPPPVPVHLLPEIEFEQFDRRGQLTLEAKRLLGINMAQVVAIDAATKELREGIEAAQAATLKARDSFSEAMFEGIVAEISPIASISERLTEQYRMQLDAILGSEIAAVLNTPIPLSTDHHHYFERVPKSGDSPQTYQLTTVLWAESPPNAAMSVHSTRHGSDRVPDYVEQFFAANPDSETP